VLVVRGEAGIGKSALPVIKDQITALRRHNA
jgi:hypothetical protein